MSVPQMLNPSAYDLLLGEIDRVIGEWRQLVASEPWSAMPSSRLVDSFPEVLPRIFRLARAGETEVDAELRELIAQAHGLMRRHDGMPLRAVAEEWNHVRRACEAVLRRNGVPDSDRDAALARLDVLIDDAIGFTLRGYYTPELDVLRGRGLERRDGDGDRRDSDGDRRT